MDARRLESERRRDGRMLMSSADLSLTGEEMVRTYFERDAVKKVFRSGKGPLSLGPLRYR